MQVDDKTIFYFITIMITIFITWQYVTNTHNADKLVQMEQYVSNSQTQLQIQPQEHIIQEQENKHCSTCPTCPAIPTNYCQLLNQPSNQQLYQQQSQSQTNIEIIQEPIMSNPLREYDYRALNDPLVPPFKRDDYTRFIPTIYTRGFPSGYKKIGILVDPLAPNDDKYKFMILMGRLKYPGGNLYDYFVTENRHNSALKFDLPNLHRELLTDDDVIIPELEKTYKLKADRNLGFDYSSFMY